MTTSPGPVLPLTATGCTSRLRVGRSQSYNRSTCRWTGRGGLIGVTICMTSAARPWPGYASARSVRLASAPTGVRPPRTRRPRQQAAVDQGEPSVCPQSATKCPPPEGTARPGTGVMRHGSLATALHCTDEWHLGGTAAAGVGSGPGGPDCPACPQSATPPEARRAEGTRSGAEDTRSRRPRRQGWRGWSVLEAAGPIEDSESRGLLLLLWWSTARRLGDHRLGGRGGAGEGKSTRRPRSVHATRTGTPARGGQRGGRPSRRRGRRGECECKPVQPHPRRTA